jgi:hypothetical protein
MVDACYLQFGNLSMACYESSNVLDTLFGLDSCQVPVKLSQWQRGLVFNGLHGAY